MEQIWWGLDSLSRPLRELVSCVLRGQLFRLVYLWVISPCVCEGFSVNSYYINTRDDGANGGIKPLFKRLVHFLKEIADNLLTPMSSKMSMSFFLQSKRKSF